MCPSHDAGCTSIGLIIRTGEAGQSLAPLRMAAVLGSQCVIFSGRRRAQRRRRRTAIVCQIFRARVDRFSPSNARNIGLQSMQSTRQLIRGHPRLRLRWITANLRRWSVLGAVLNPQGGSRFAHQHSRRRLYRTSLGNTIAACRLHELLPSYSY